MATYILHLWLLLGSFQQKKAVLHAFEDDCRSSPGVGRNNIFPKQMYPNFAKKIELTGLQHFHQACNMKGIKKKTKPCPFKSVHWDRGVGVFFGESCMSCNGYVGDQATVALLQTPPKWLPSLFLLSLSLCLFLSHPSLAVSLTHPSLPKIVLALITLWLKAGGGV